MPQGKVYIHFKKQRNKRVKALVYFADSAPDVFAIRDMFGTSFVEALWYVSPLDFEVYKEANGLLHQNTGWEHSIF